ncbi:uncharacterized protein LOC62_03G003822 [Vanrija pseudolonga]|uniref:Uncharacterized protein n=1 Tax=Vanrija pseudolonga TaxID=143232 RepID=A0AAF1BGW2_9TREE|nr:hypothetical protein LOC62_03G003822 [Vanrija pseudolonga]
MATASPPAGSTPPATQWQPYSYHIDHRPFGLRHIFEAIVELVPEAFRGTNHEVHEYATSLLFKHVTIAIVKEDKVDRDDVFGTVTYKMVIPEAQTFALYNTATAAKLPFPSFKVTHLDANFEALRQPQVRWLASSSGHWMAGKRRQELFDKVHIVDSRFCVPRSVLHSLPNLQTWRSYLFEHRRGLYQVADLPYVPRSPTVVFLGRTRFEQIQTVLLSHCPEKIVVQLHPFQVLGNYRYRDRCRTGIKSGKPSCLVLIVNWRFPSEDTDGTLDTDHSADSTNVDAAIYTDDTVDTDATGPYSDDRDDTDDAGCTVNIDNAIDSGTSNFGDAVDVRDTDGTDGTDGTEDTGSTDDADDTDGSSVADESCYTDDIDYPKWLAIASMLYDIARYLPEYAKEYGPENHPQSKVRFVVVDLESGLNQMHALKRPTEETLSLDELLQIDNWKHSPLLPFWKLDEGLKDLSSLCEASPSFLSLQEYKAGLSHKQALIEFDSRDDLVIRCPDHE